MLLSKQNEEERGWEKELSKIPVGQLHTYPMTAFPLVCLIHVVLEVLSVAYENTAVASALTPFSLSGF